MKNNDGLGQYSRRDLLRSAGSMRRVLCGVLAALCVWTTPVAVAAPPGKEDGGRFDRPDGRHDASVDLADHRVRPFGRHDASVDVANHRVRPCDWHKACVDGADHRVWRVPVERGVWLEVLDWGGAGEPMVLLTDLGNSAHVFDEFAYQFTDRFRVLAITRRGYGLSSAPLAGYDIATRVADDLRVLDFFRIPRAVFVGHSIAGVELSRLGAQHPDRVSKLVYLDAFDYGKLSPAPPLGTTPPDPVPQDGFSVLHYQAYTARTGGMRAPVADTCNLLTFDREGHVIGSKTRAEVQALISSQSGAADFAGIAVPALGIFAVPQGDLPHVALLDPEDLAAYREWKEEWNAWQADVLQRMRTGMKDLELLTLPGANHYLFLTQEAEVVQHMRAFLLDSED